MPPKREIIHLGETDWYDKPAWYDILHHAGTSEEADSVEAIARRFLPRTTKLRILEPACGTARLLRTLSARGHSVAGFDMNPAMVEYARASFARRGLKGSIWQDSMESFTLPRAGAKFDLVINFINTIRHLPDKQSLTRHLARVREVLQPKGVAAIGLSIMGEGIEHPSEDVWSGARGPCRVTQLVQYLPPESPEQPTAKASSKNMPKRAGSETPRFETVLSHLTVTTPRREVHLDTTYRLRAWTGPEWLRIVRASGLEPVAVVDENALDLGGSASPPETDTQSPAPPCHLPQSWDTPHAHGYAIWILSRKHPRK
ncbi:MAG: class I SAM-dependent methyltransferase [Phycisphaeraceae bacterium]|nr:MAG: class I SAM-dependent methyltransferase [Phycisphaeraceae bacterium]